MCGSLVSSGTLSTKSPFVRTWHISRSLEYSKPWLRYFNSAGELGVRFSAPASTIALQVVHLPFPPQSVIQSIPASWISRNTGFAASFTVIVFCPKFSITIFTIDLQVSGLFCNGRTTQPQSS